MAEPDEMPFTGERFTRDPALAHSQIYFEHLHRYLFATQFVGGKSVLDIASGEGYGSDLLLKSGAEKVVGVDIDENAIRHAERKYPAPGLSFIKGSCTHIPIADRSVDVVVSFETIEHIEEHEAFFDEIGRVLRPGGKLVLSSPDRDEYLARGEEKNPFHRRELTASEFEQRLRSRYGHVKVLGQRLVAGSMIAGKTSDQETGGAIQFTLPNEAGETRSSLHRPLYLLAVCCDEPLEPIATGVFEQRETSAQIWDVFERARGAPLADTSARARILALEAELDARGQWAQSLDREVQSLRNAIERERNLFEQEKSEWTEAFKRMEERRSILQTAKEELASALEKQRNEFELARNGWLLEREADLKSLHERLASAQYKAVILAQEKADLQVRLTHLTQETTAGQIEQTSRLMEAHERDRFALNAEIQNLTSSLGKARETADTARMRALTREADYERISLMFSELSNQHSILVRESGESLSKMRQEKDEQGAALARCVAELSKAVEMREEQLVEAQNQLLHALSEARRASTLALSLDNLLRRERSGTSATAAEELKQMKTSWSWRITAPLRAAHYALGDPLYRRKKGA